VIKEFSAAGGIQAFFYFFDTPFIVLDESVHSFRDKTLAVVALLGR
jgi:hypothetical protein